MRKYAILISFLTLIFIPLIASAAAAYVVELRRGIREEKAHIEKVWAEFYAGLESVPILIDTETMVRYGVSTTPTFVLIDRKGIMRFYSPMRLSEAALSKRIETILAEAP